MPSPDVQVLTDARELEPFAAAWEALRAAAPRPHVEHRIDWLALEERLLRHHQGQLAVIGLFAGEALVGAVPLLVRDYRWPCRIGYWSLARPRVRLARLCGERPLLPPDPAAYAAAIGALAALPAEVIYLEGLPAEGEFWRQLRKDVACHRTFWLHAPWPATPHHYIRIEGSFDEYVRRFSGRTRRKLRYAERGLERECGSRVWTERVAEIEQVLPFLGAAEQISTRSWQARKLGKCLCRGQDEERLLEYAQRGWLRSYLLRCETAPIAFLVGVQADGVYYVEHTAFDPWRARWSPGRLLHLRMLADLFQWERPAWVDFRRGDADHKRTWGTVSEPEVSVYLVRRTARMLPVLLAQRLTTRLERWGRAGLAALGCRRRARQRCRR